MEEKRSTPPNPWILPLVLDWVFRNSSSSPWRQVQLRLWMVVDSTGEQETKHHFLSSIRPAPACPHPTLKLVEYTWHQKSCQFRVCINQYGLYTNTC